MSSFVFNKLEENFIFILSIHLFAAWDINVMTGSLAATMDNEAINGGGIGRGFSLMTLWSCHTNSGMAKSNFVYEKEIEFYWI